MPVLTYGEDPAVGFAGMISENFTSPQMMESALAEGELQVGDAVQLGTANQQFAPLAAAADFAGVVVYFAGIEKDPKALPGAVLKIADKQQCAVMHRGRVWVIAGGAVTKGAEVVPSTGASTKFTAGNGEGQVRAVAISEAAADGDLLEIELQSYVLAPADS